MKFQDLFWWLEAPKKIIWNPFWWLILSAVVFLIPLLRVWWWLLIPLIFAVRLQSLYLWWISWDQWYFNRHEKRYIILELTPPKEVLAPFSAMEDVFSVVWSVVDVANWREIWCEGELPLGPYWCSWEIASVEGDIHFYVRCLTEHRHVIESVLYSHYPELEIRQVADYTKNVPQNIPNEEWDLYGEDYIFGDEPGRKDEQKNSYPIKTYSKFFEPQGERISQEEKRIDPIVSMLEEMARLGPGEQFWFQLIVTPIVDQDIPWRDEAKKLITKLSRRPEKKEKTFWDEISEMFSELISGIFSAGGEEEKKGKSKEKSIPLTQSESGEKEMIITPGEREILAAIEEKIKKPAFKVNLRGLYIAKRDSWQSPHGKIARAYFTHFAAQNLNYIRFWLKTRSKVHYILRAKRKYLRQRKFFMNYVKRFPPLFPIMVGEGNPIFNTEELATIFHFPTKISGLVAPTVSRVEAKKGGPPPDLPVE